MAKTFEPFTTPISAIDDVLLLSASAGTGKTWMVTHLAARWLIEEPHHDASQVLLVTFTKNAASELKYRLRERVIEFGEVLRALTSEAGNRLVINPLRTSQQWDELMNAQWVQGLRRSYGPRELSDMLDRQIRVLQTLDDANARTLHSFASLVGQSDEREAQSSNQIFERAVALSITDYARSQPDALQRLMQSLQSKGTVKNATKLSRMLQSALAATSSVGGSRFDKVAYVPDEIPSEVVTTALSLVRDSERVAERIEELERVISFDSLIADLYQQTLDDDGSLVERMRHHFGLVLVDEFQDTDVVQWDILTSLFRNGPSSVPIIAVGDPKQAIYSFRGGDVTVFQKLELHVATCDRCATHELQLNYRSQGHLLRQLNSLFEIGGVAGWHFSSGSDLPLVNYVPVMPSAHHDNDEGSFEIRDIVHDGEEKTNQQRTVAVLINDVIRTVVTLLDEASSERVDPEEIAILCRGGWFMELLAEKLERANIRTVTVRSLPIFEAEAARQIRWLLWALCQPTNVRRTNVLAATWFRHHEHEVLSNLARALELESVSSFQRRLLDGPTMAVVLATSTGQRNWTDLEHVLELMGDNLTLGATPQEAYEWIEERMRESQQFSNGEAVQRRIESSEGAVRIMTIHAAKGLEFPVVLVPQIERLSKKPSNGISSWTNGSQRVIDTASLVSSDATLDPRAARSSRDDSRRLIYVALTRAEQRLIAWRSELDKHLIGPDESIQSVLGTEKEITALNQWRLLSDALREEIRGSSSPGRAFPTWTEVRTSEFVEAPLQRTSSPPSYVSSPSPVPILSEHLRRWSYSALALHNTTHAFGDVDDGRAPYDSGAYAEDNEDESTLLANVGDDAFGGLRGPVLGNAIHEIFEKAVGHLRSSSDEIDALVIETLEKYRLSTADDHELNGVVIRSMRQLLTRSMGNLFDGVSLDSFCGLRPTRVTSEMRFTLPLRGTYEDGHDRLRGIGALVVEGDPEGPYRRFFEDIANTSVREPRLLEGFLTGSIDLVAQVGSGADQRFVVVDYKTNVLKVSDNYGALNLIPEMAMSGYPLQGLLYSVALHRFLKTRLRHYVPHQHLGGMTYYYVRGATNAANDPDIGLANWKVPANVVVSVSDYLANGSA